MSGTDAEGRSGELDDQVAGVCRRLDTLQGHLCSYAARSVPVVGINFTTFHDTLDRLHDYLLQCMELAMEPPA